MPEMTTSALQSLLGDEFFVQRRRGGSFQVDLSALKSADAYAAHGRPNLFKQVATLKAGFEALRDAGYNVYEDDVRASFPGRRENERVPWLHIWVNPGTSQSAAPSAEVASLTNQVTELTKLVAQLIGNQQAPAPVQTDENGDGTETTQQEEDGKRPPF